MAILEKEVWVNLAPANIKHYETLGYNIPRTNNRVLRGTKILVKLEHLLPSSNVQLTKICDFCNGQTNDSFKSINKSRGTTDGKDRCKSCGIKYSRKIMVLNYSFPLEKSISYKFPYLAEEWCYERNTSSPYSVSSFSSIPVWWKCRKNKNHLFFTSPVNRTYKKNSGCPFCRGTVRNYRGIVEYEGSLTEKYPELIMEWHPSLNGSIRPENIRCKSNKKTWWICSKKECRHIWPATVYDRTIRHKGCPKCRESKGEKIISYLLQEKEIQFSSQHRIKECRNKLPLPFDFAIFKQNKKIKILIEYDGRQHFKPVSIWGGNKGCQEDRRRCEIKNTYCIKNNIPLIRIPYWEYDNIENILSHVLGYYKLIENQDVDKELVHKFLVSHTDWSHEKYIMLGEQK